MQEIMKINELEERVSQLELRLDAQSDYMVNSNASIKAIVEGCKIHLGLIESVEKRATILERSVNETKISELI